LLRERPQCDDGSEIQRCSLFFPGYFTSLVNLPDQSVAGRIGTAISFSVVFLSILEIVYTALLVPGSPFTIVGRSFFGRP
jgi:hypothetical protein